MPKKTPLYEEHQQLQAKMIDFAGWLMPLDYGSQIEEHLWVRKAAGVFDVSHMTCIDIEGKEAKVFLRKMLANDVQKLQGPGKALYSCMLNENAGVIDDLIAYRLSESAYRLVVNAATTEKDLAWLEKNAQHFAVNLKARFDLGILAIQGPSAWEKVQKVFTDKQQQATQGLKRFSAVAVNNWLIARTGYTGEDGLEIMLPQAEMITLWQKLLANEVRPMGLGARDSLRLEAGLNLYGADMDESVTPLESNLRWTIDNTDPAREFIGKEALLQQQQAGVRQHLVGLVLLDKGICRAGMDVLKTDGATSICGKLTSGGFSPTLSCGIALGRVANQDDQAMFIQIRDKKVPAKRITLPFVKQGKANFS